jgi:superoxide reductase
LKGVFEMSQGQKFYVCKHCHKIIGIIQESPVDTICCGEAMQVLVPNTVEASNEKHLPVVAVEGNLVKVQVGSTEHPMLPEHFIQWIYLETKEGGQRKSLQPNAKPEAVFALQDDEAIAVYAYCNLHGLWKTDL